METQGEDALKSKKKGRPSLKKYDRIQIILAEALPFAHIRYI